MVYTTMTLDLVFLFYWKWVTNNEKALTNKIIGLGNNWTAISDLCVKFYFSSTVFGNPLCFNKYYSRIEVSLVYLHLSE